MRKTESRKNYTIKPKITAGINKYDFALFPTVIYYPWRYRLIGHEVMTIMWLCFYIGVGQFEKKPERGGYNDQS